MNKEEIFNYCKNISKKEEITFKYIKSESEKAEFRNFSIENYKMNNIDKLFIRVIDKGKIGSYSIQGITKEKIEKGIKKAKDIAKNKKSEVKFESFGKDVNHKQIKSDFRIENVDFSKKLEEIKKNLTKDKYIQGYLGGISKNHIESFFINPYFSKENKKDFVSLSSLVITKNKKKSSGDFFSIFTKEEDIDINQTFMQAKHNAYTLMDPVNGEKGEYTLIFTPEITREFFEFILSGTKGEAIEKKNSFLHDSLGKKIFSENINLKEEPTLDYFLSSSKIDDEGFKTSKKNIINKGVFRKPIYNLYESIKYNKKPTGNAFLENGFDPEYTNIIQDASNKKIEDMISKTKKGILIYEILGFHTNKITTGDFSLTISSGKAIRDGQFKETVTNLNLTGNLRELFREIEFSKEQKFFGSSLYSFSKIQKVKLI
jgi:PmbA protein